MNRMIAVMGLGVGLLATPSAALALGLTYYVDAATGDDSLNDGMSAATPWKTITRGVFHAQGGDTVMVSAGTYFETVESKRDGFSTSTPIVLKATVPGAAIVQPPAGTNGFFISHNYHTIDGFKVADAFHGIKLGPHDGGGQVVGLLVQNNRINGNIDNGIIVSSGLDIEIAFNTVKGNGTNGISYSGDASLIHDNVVHHNAQFGIYVKDGANHQVYDNTAYLNGDGSDDDNIKILGLTIPPPAQTYYVDCGVNGDDTRTPIQAKDPASPWKTITKGVFHAQAGSTILVNPGTCAERVESKRDGTKAARIVLKSMVPGGAIIQPPAGTNGFFISHNYHTIDGFKVTGAFQGLKLGPHEVADGPVIGLIVQNNRINGNTNNGIGVSNGAKIEIAFNTLKNNGANGISYSGNSSRIHDNIVQQSAQFGIYVKDGINHLVYDNTAFQNGIGDDDNIKILGLTLPTPVQTYYVDCANGNDGHTTTQAKNLSTPWRTIKKALQVADGGDTVSVLPGLCGEPAIESQRDGSSGAPITIAAQAPGTVIIDPPSGNGFFIAHNYHTLSGLIVTGATGNGIQVGPHDVGGGSVTGVVIDDCQVHHNAVTGVKFSKAIKGRVQHSVVHSNGSHGISYSGSGARIFNNLVHSNGCAGPGCGDYGISILGVAGFTNTGHTITNNTIYGNLSGGLRLSDDQGSAVFGSAVNNIIMASPVGIKEQGGGSFTLDYNDVFANAEDNYQLSGSGIGANSISVYPEFVDPVTKDFRLKRVGAGQTVNSPCIDAGSTTAAAGVIGGRTAFTDLSPDVGIVDLGYHGTEL
jgi:parallel beta-helix repeat protein